MLVHETGGPVIASYCKGYVDLLVDPSGASDFLCGFTNTRPSDKRDVTLAPKSTTGATGDDSTDRRNLADGSVVFLPRIASEPPRRPIDTSRSQTRRR